MEEALLLKKDYKRIGLGSISLLLFIFGLLFSISFANQEAYGEFNQIHIAGKGKGRLVWIDI